MNLLTAILINGTRAYRGACLLNERRPNWHHNVDLSVFEMANTCRCVLGQNYARDINTSAFGIGLAAIGLEGFDIGDGTSASHGFDFPVHWGNDSARRTYGGNGWVLLDEAWICLIKQRYEQGV